VPDHTAKLAQDWIVTNCSEFIVKDEWPPNSLDVNALDYHVWGVMLEHYKTFHPKPKNTVGLKNVLQLKWAQLPPDSINKTILSFTKRVRVCVKAVVDISNLLWHKLFNNNEHWTLQVTVNFWHNLEVPNRILQKLSFLKQWKYFGEILKDCWKTFPCKSWNFGFKISIGCWEITFCPLGHF